MPGQTVAVDGHRLTLTNLDKVLYPATGTTKGDVLAYLAAVAPVLLPHCADRPATRKRWPEGTAGPVFFQKNLDAGTPDWVRRRDIVHRSGTTTYPLVNDLATLTWLGQVAALEIHVPQWRFGRTGVQRNPDRLVLDLDPGPGAGLAECAEVAHLARTILTGMGLDPLPVTSGSKGIHLYAALDGRSDAGAVSAVAHELARHLEAEHGDLVVADMKKSLRAGKVLVDWSQNNGAKTTIAPYSLRGRERPYVAAPRMWEELDDPELAHLEAGEVLRRLARMGDPLAALETGRLAGLEPTPQRMATFTPAPPERDRLAVYRSMRDPARTPEPVPGEPAATVDYPGRLDSPGHPGADNDAGAAGAAPSGNTFVIQEHHARRLHWDFRLEHDGVLVSWALPKGEPTDPGRNHLAVQTEDHPLAYGSFEGTIPAGEYGAGKVSIWDAGTYEAVKWRDGKEVIAVLHGERHGTRRLALIHTGDEQSTSWLIHRMRDGGEDGPPPAGRGDTPGQGAGESPASGSAAAPSHAPPDPTPPRSRPALPRPMLATAGTAAEVSAGDWALEMKWDGFRALIEVTETVRVISRSGKDMTTTFPELAAVAGLVAPEDTPLVLDGEIVALDRTGRPSFRRLQQRANLARPADVAAARARVGVEYMAFDVLEIAGRSLRERPYRERRHELERVLTATAPIHVPPAFDGDVAAALATSKKLALEGVVAKRQDGRYVPGRSRGWIKIKHVRAQEVVVVGWRPGHGGRGHLMGSLLLAVPDGAASEGAASEDTTSEDTTSDGRASDGEPRGAGRLRYVGRVGSGFTDAERRDIPGLLTARKTPAATGVPDEDARDAMWVRPDRVAEVTYGEWTGSSDGPSNGGRAGDGSGDPGADPGKLRHAVWRGWRTDKAPSDVVVEPPPAASS